LTGATQPDNDLHGSVPTDRRGALLMGLLAAVVVAVGAVVLVPWDWVPGGQLVPATPDRLFTAAEIERAEEFATLRRTLSWSSYGISLLVACLLGFSPLGARMLRRLGRRLRWWLAVPVGVLALLLIGRVVTLPFALLVRRQNLDYDLSRQDLAGWALDRVLSLGVSWLVTSLLLLALVGLARRGGRHWYAWAGGVAALLVVAGSFLFPVLVEPVFNTFTPLSDGPLRDRVLVLAERQGVEVNEVLVADASRRTTTLNAYVSGLGETRRVVLYDTLLEQVPVEEIEVIVAHELAHAKHEDVLVGTLLGAGGAVLGVSMLALSLRSPRVRSRSEVGGAGDPASVALVLALVAVGGFVASPVVNSVSRAVEMRADRESLAATGEDEAFMQIHRRLAIEAVSDPPPPRWSQFWFGSHPTVLERAGLPSSMEVAAR